MIPIRDINPRVRLPIVNVGLIATAVLVFFVQLGLGFGDDGERFVRVYGFVPHDLTLVINHEDVSAWLVLRTLVTSIFLHGGWFHIIGNLLYLRVFGDNIEDRLGHIGYLCFFVFGGVAGALAQYWVDPVSGVPMIGASGAIAAVLGAYIVVFPGARILTLFPVFIFLTFIEVRAIFFLGLWALQQFLNGYLLVVGGAKLAAASGGVAWFAHIGGFGFGICVGIVMRIVGRKNAAKRRR